MADDAEEAFFQSQSMNKDFEASAAPENQLAADADDDEYDHSNTLDDQPEASDPDAQLNQASAEMSAANPPDTSDMATGVDSDTKDPSVATPPAESQTSTPVPPADAPAQSRPRTIGGFDVDSQDEDYGEDEEADYEPPAVLEVDVSNAMSQEPSSGNANQNTFPDVSSQATVQGSANVPDVSNSSYSSVPPSNIDPSTAQAQWASHEASLQNSIAPTPVPGSPSTTKGRLPHDHVGILQDRVSEDPRGDTAAWLELIAEHRSRNRIDSAREVYEQFVAVFPMAADQWQAYAAMESDLNELWRLEQIFSRTLFVLPSVRLWSYYLDYVRRKNPLTTDDSEKARRTINGAYNLALDYVGVDKDSGNIWSDYVEFIRSGPGHVGGSGWQDQQKMDLLRKAYQKAIGVPMQSVNALWKEYDQFEMGLNKLTGRKFLQEQSPSYMTARSSYIELQNITRELIRTTVPRLPPVPGSEGDVEFAQQVDVWKRWIAWEKGDPLVLKDEDAAAFKARVVYVYKQALMALRFLPEIWFEAADFCFLNDMEKEGNAFLTQGIEANPESCLLAFKQADRLEVTSSSEQDSYKRAGIVRAPYDKLLDSLYGLINKAQTQETNDVSRIEETFAKENPDYNLAQNDDDDDFQGELKKKQAAKQAQIDAVRNAHSIQITALSKIISHAWIALMRAMRRVRGKGTPTDDLGSRLIFSEARKRGRITSDVYIASALIEYHCYKDGAATKIFERGSKLFPEDEQFALEYLKHLIDINDIVNARAVFEMTVQRLVSKAKTLHKAKPIFAFLHEYESQYGDLVQVINLETRMRELWPEDTSLEKFSHRYITPSFDPISVRPILSPTQTRPKYQYSDAAAEALTSPAPGQFNPPLSSPKRPYPGDDFDYDSDRPRKFARADSPLRSTQGRRVDQQKRAPHLNGQAHSQYKPQGSPAPLPRAVVELLSKIPHASAYNICRLSPEKMIDLIRNTAIPASTAEIPLPANVRNLGAAQAANPQGGKFNVWSFSYLIGWFSPPSSVLRSNSTHSNPMSSKCQNPSPRDSRPYCSASR
ncbi:hypothetical protein N7532_004646 [Penicillium argentinense]|uniref:mRNA 3'-end-processing protein RNA14 n=1 Tax=Penicillium argentinense TaxID=1131581 RepID=A0A9W9KGC4_9EURO|nr:uncharacterized protein N7532_004646 [Penicillium argentinense]KAJ5104117.1 hypothetical protein N7532_004646 [Penicillium argentinense]